MTEKWERYYDAVEGLPPRDTLLLALERLEADLLRDEGVDLAVDLGCGEGRDTLELLRRGWRVLAIDAEIAGIERLRARLADQPEIERLETLVERFETARWPAAALVNSSFALPFCPPERFEGVWGRIAASLPTGGRFSGQLFGVRDGWAADPELTFLTRSQIEDLLQGFTPERLDEVEQDGSTATGRPKHWHVFHVVARRT